MRFILFLTLLVSFAVAAPSYQELVKKVQAKDFAGANAGLESYVKGRWKTGEQEKAVVIYIETCIRLGKIDEAVKYADQFLEFFPKSKYRERVETTVAISALLDKNPYFAAETLRRILAYTQNPVASARARELLSKIFTSDLLSANELKNLLEKNIKDEQAKKTAQISLGKKMQKENRYKAARYWFSQAGADSLKAQLEGKGVGTPIILVLAPLSGNHAELGNYMVQGVYLLEDSLKGKAKIQIVDDRADPVTALAKVKQAIAQDSIIAVIGPLLSGGAATVAAWMSEKTPQIPLITPTATDNGIAEIGKNIFQLNVNSAELASSIANYAINCLQVKEFAIMAPLGYYGSLMTEEFQRAVEKSGGSIIATQNYAEGLPDYQNEFKLLRDRKRTLDSRRGNMSMGRANVSNVYKRDTATLTFPAIFIPSTNPADAGLMAAQVAFNKIRVDYLLGSSGWAGREFLYNAKKQAEGTFFSSAFLPNGENESKEFIELFKNKWQKEPDENKVAGLSYDAVGIIKEAMQSTNPSLAAAILQKKEYNSVYGKIIFTEIGANKNVNLISVEQTKFIEKSKECKDDQNLK